MPLRMRRGVYGNNRRLLWRKLVAASHRVVFQVQVALDPPLAFKETLEASAVGKWSYVLL